MNLYKTECRNSKGKKDIYVVAYDIESAMKKTSKVINSTPEDLDDWHLDSDPILLASTKCIDGIDLLGE